MSYKKNVFILKIENYRKCILLQLYQSPFFSYWLMNCVLAMTCMKYLVNLLLFESKGMI